MGDYSRMIDGVLEQFGLDAYESRIDKNAWAFTRGSAPIFILLNEPENEEEFGWFAVRSPIAKLPKQNLPALYRWMLEKNEIETRQSRFCIAEDETITVILWRPLAAMDPIELATCIMDVGDTADNFDDYIINEFGAIPYDPNA